MHQPLPRTLRHGLLALTAVLVVACGSDDDSGDALADNDARDSVLDAVGDGSDTDVDAAIAGLSPETRYGIVADQLDPTPEVEIDGASIRLAFGDGSVTNAVMDCILASAIQRSDETLTLAYPDGEKVC